MVRTVIQHPVDVQIDRVETAITTACKALAPDFWRAARTTPAAAITLAESIEALVDLYRERRTQRACSVGV